MILNPDWQGGGWSQSQSVVIALFVPVIRSGAVISACDSSYDRTVCIGFKQGGDDAGDSEVGGGCPRGGGEGSGEVLKCGGAGREDVTEDAGGEEPCGGSNQGGEYVGGGGISSSGINPGEVLKSGGGSY